MFIFFKYKSFKSSKTELLIADTADTVDGIEKCTGCDKDFFATAESRKLITIDMSPSAIRKRHNLHPMDANTTRSETMKTQQNILDMEARAVKRLRCRRGAMGEAELKSDLAILYNKFLREDLRDFNLL